MVHAIFENEKKKKKITKKNTSKSPEFSFFHANLFMCTTYQSQPCGGCSKSLLGMKGIILNARPY